MNSFLGTTCKLLTTRKFVSVCLSNCDLRSNTAVEQDVSSLGNPEGLLGFRCTV